MILILTFLGNCKLKLVSYIKITIPEKYIHFYVKECLTLLVVKTA